MPVLMTGPLLMVASAAAWAAGLVLTKVTLDRSGAAPSSVLLVQLTASVGVLAVASLAAGVWPRGVLVSLSTGNGTGSQAGDALVVASVAAAALYVVVGSRQVTAVRPLPAALSQQAWALGFVAVRHVALSGRALWPQLGLDGLLLAALSGVVNYALPFWLYLSALTRMPVARAATYLTLIPVFGVLGSVALLGERIGWLDILGSTLWSSAPCSWTPPQPHGRT